MDQEQINKIEAFLESKIKTYVAFDNELNMLEVIEPDLKKMDIMIKYLIYQQLKELNNNLSLIDEALSINELKK